MENYKFHEDELLKKLNVLKWNGFPCFSAVYINDKLENIKINKKWTKETTPQERHKNHAEFILIDELDFEVIKEKEIVIVQTFPPCSHCLEKIKTLNLQLNIVWLFDPYQKTSRKLWNETKDISFNRISRNYEALIDFNFIKFLNRMNYKSHSNSRKALLIRHNGNLENIKYA